MDINNIAIDIKEFGAHSITESGYSAYNSSTAINNAIKYAKNNGYSAVNFGSGKFYAVNIVLESNIVYFSTGYCELITPAGTPINSALLNMNGMQNIKILNLNLNGNWNNVNGSDQAGVCLIACFNSTKVTIQNNVLHDNRYIGVLLAGCDFVNIENNIIYETDCGIETMGTASNHLIISKNTIYGVNNQQSEPISIYNDSTQMAKDILISENVIFNKQSASGIYIGYVENVSVLNNIIHDCAAGVTVGSHYSGIASRDIVISSNLIYDCSTGIGGELQNSDINDNTMHDLQFCGIDISKLNGNNNSYLSIKGNTIRDVNIGNKDCECIRLSDISNSSISENNCIDTRTIPLNYTGIRLLSNGKSNNIFNNGNLNSSNSFQIIISSSCTNNYLFNNAGRVLDRGIGTKILSTADTWENKIYSQLVIADNFILNKQAEAIFIGVSGTVAVNTIAVDRIYRKVTLLFNQLTITLKNGTGNLKLSSDYVPTTAGISNITLLCDGTSWIELSRVN